MKQGLPVVIKFNGGKRPLGGVRHRWDINIKMVLQDVWSEDAD
jgi:hypothetical protein